MISDSPSQERPLANEDGKFYWNVQRVPHTLPDGITTHPGRSSAIFVVHGMGEQRWTETATQLRAGFEDALEAITAWQMAHLEEASDVTKTTLPPPFIFDGYWANYVDVHATFPEDYQKFNEREQTFFGNLWKHRVVSGARTMAWVLRQQLRLLHPKVLCEVGILAWILYWPLQIVSATVLLYAWVRHREAITGYLNDLRLYLEPQGCVERAIVQRIDDRVGHLFLSMIGIDWEFRPLSSSQLIEVGGEHLRFNRVVWVAHSLGTVISYNVLSALFHKADEINVTGDAEQRAGVELFRHSLSRFVTMGSPLDKVAFLFRRKSLRPWPNVRTTGMPNQSGSAEDFMHRGLITDGETVTTKDPNETEWWINFYHVFDPVSGALCSPFICGKQPPSNIHIRSGLPGFAHVAYWKDRTTLRFILGRTFGQGYLRDQEYKPLRPWVLSALAALAYFTWVAILFGSLFAGGYVIYRWGPYILQGIGTAMLKWILG